METPKEIFLKDYKVPDYYFSKVGMYAIDYRKIYIDDNLHMEQSYWTWSVSFSQVDLNFILGEDKTIVHSKIIVCPRDEGNSHLWLWLIIYTAV